MDIEKSKQGEVCVLEPIGRLDGDSAPEFEKRLLGAVDDGEKNFLVDCARLEYISSAGLRVFLTGAKKVRAVDGSIIVCGLGASVREVFEISGFLNIFTVHDDRAQALAAEGQGQ